MPNFVAGLRVQLLNNIKYTYKFSYFDKGILNIFTEY